MNTNIVLQRLFSEKFGDGHWSEDGQSTSCKFKCKNKEECGIKRGSPQYTGCLGSPNTDIMVVAEAPSVYIN